MNIQKHPPGLMKKQDIKKLNKGDSKGLLYNLKDDLGQRNNLYEKFPEKVKAMEALLKQYRTSGRSIPQR